MSEHEADDVAVTVTVWPLAGGHDFLLLRRDARPATAYIPSPAAGMSAAQWVRDLRAAVDRVHALVDGRRSWPVLRIGDDVRLATGSPPMKVAEIKTISFDPPTLVEWFESTGRKGAWYRASELRKTEDEG